MKKTYIYTAVVWMFLYALSASAQGVSVFADLLNWQASEETATSWATIVSDDANQVTHFSPKSVSFNWNRGFRGGIIYHADCPNWDAKLYWTYFPSSASMNFPVRDQVVIPGFFSGFLSGDIFFGAMTNWNLVMNMIDLEVSHAFNIGKSFTLRPAIGLKGGTINQTMKSKWEAVLYTATEKVKNNFSGAAPSFGLDAQWKLCGGFNLVGNLSTALMWGRWNDTDTYQRPAAFLVSPTTITTSMNHSMLGVLMLGSFVGLEWVHKGNCNVAVKLGYEVQYWANQLRFTTFQQLPTHGDLTFQGGTCGICIDL